MSLKVPRWLQFKERITGDTDVGSTLDEGIANRPLRDLYDNQVSINNGLDGHVNNKQNPHGTNKTHVGLSNVSNFTATDATNDSSTVKYALANGVKKAYDKAVAVLTDLTSHKNNKSNPHGVTCDQIQAVKRSGDTMTGNLLFPDLSKGLGFAQTPGAPTSDGAYICIESLTDLGNNELVITKTDGNGGSPDDGILFNWKAKDGANINQGKYLRLHASKIEFGHKNIYTTDNQRLYHQGFKPTKADVGLSQVNNWPATSAVNDSSSSKYATALGVKTAYDKAVASQGTANNAVMKAGDTMTGDLNFPATGSVHYDVGRCDKDKTNTEKQAIRFSDDGSLSIGADRAKNTSAKIYIRPEGVNSGSNIHSFSTTGLAVTGQISVSGTTPTASSHLTRKDYVDTQASLKVSKAGDTMTGNLILKGETARLFVACQLNAAPVIDLAIGDSDSGFNWTSDGKLEGWANNIKTFEWDSTKFQCNKPMYADSTQRVFADNYHPNADKLTTARKITVTLTGDVTGAAYQTFDGTGDRDIRIATTVADNSHNHSNYLPLVGGTMTGDLILSGSSTGLFVAHQQGSVSPPSIDLAIGDSDSGFNWVTDGSVQGYANSTPIFGWTTSEFKVEKNIRAMDGLSTVKGITCGTNMSVGGSLSVNGTTTCTGKVTVNNDLAIKQGTICYNTEEQSMEFIV